MNEQSVDLKYPGPYPVFFMGASAGGVKAMSTIAQMLPEDFPAPVFMVLHRKRVSNYHSKIFEQVIRSKTRLIVKSPVEKRPGEGDLVKAGHIYVPAPDRHLGVEDNCVVSLEEPSQEIWRPGIDVLFKMGAREYRDRAVCMLLTGGLNDGVAGLKETTHLGGITVAQSPSDAYDPVLPLNALLKDHPAYVLPVRDMVSLMCELCHYDFSPEQKSILANAAMTAKREKKELKAS